MGHEVDAAARILDPKREVQRNKRLILHDKHPETIQIPSGVGHVSPPNVYCESRSSAAVRWIITPPGVQSYSIAPSS